MKESAVSGPYLPIIASILASAIAVPAYAAAGDLWLRVGASAMDPGTESESFSSISRSEVRLDSGATLSAAAAWFVTDYAALEISSSLPYNSDLEGNRRLKDLGLGKIGDVKYVPTYLTMNFYFNDSSAVTPYLGGGIAFNKFYDEQASPAGLDVNLDSTFDPTVVAGVNMDFGAPVVVNFDVRYTPLDTDATFSGAIDQTVEMEIDPAVFTLGVGYRF